MSAHSAKTPQTLVMIAQIAGWDAAMRLVQHVGGQSRRIPHESTEEHWLYVLVGPEAAAAICQHFGGDVLTVPRNLGEMYEVRNRLIRSERPKTTIRGLATKWGLTERQIYNVLGSVEE
jgi:hypothetical protein